MSTETNIPFNVRPDAFAGTARSYLKFRPPYPAVMLDDLRKRANVSGSGRLLDLDRQGYGQLALNSVETSFAPEELKDEMRRGIADWVQRQ